MMYHVINEETLEAVLFSNLKKVAEFTGISKHTLYHKFSRDKLEWFKKGPYMIEKMKVN